MTYISQIKNALRAFDRCASLKEINEYIEKQNKLSCIKTNEIGGQE